jgi:hypothetical protein
LIPDISPETRLRQAPSMLQSEVDGDVVALNIDRGMCYGLNNIGSRIWRLLEQWTTLGSICSTLTREYDVDPQTCEAEVRRLLNELAEERLIEVQPA